jgi:hypothetical protein
MFMRHGAVSAFGGKADSSRTSLNIHTWHLASFGEFPGFGRYRRHSDHFSILALNVSVAIDPMYGPAVRCKWILPSWR